MSKRIYNFNPGPSTLPLSVLEKAQKELLNYKNTGMSVMEISHRSTEFENIIFETKEKLKKLLEIDDSYDILFLQGGASTQFSMIPMNLLPENKVANYVISGSFAEKSHIEAKLFGKTHIVATSKESNYNCIPSFDESNISSDAAYLHITTNNTIYGTQYKEYPDIPGVPLIADMSSDILSKKINTKKFSLIYAGAQKNLGPSGVTIVIIHKSLLDISSKSLPTMSRYDIMAKNNSLYNTPPTFSIYLVNLVLDWIIENGGISEIEAHNEEKANYIYNVIDNSNGFYAGHSVPEHRSTMNITFTLRNNSLETDFISLAKERGIIGIQGHRSVGGMRASIYNAMSKEGCKELAEFMVYFQNKYK